MAVRLDHILEPGERVVWRPRRRWLRPGLLLLMGFMALYLLFSFLVWDLSARELYASAGIILLLAVLPYALSNAAKAVLTDRRILTQSGGSQPIFEEFRFAEIEAVETIYALPGFSVCARTRDGRVICVDEPRDPADLVRALTDAGLSVAGPPRRRIRTITLSSELLCWVLATAGILAIAWPLSLWLHGKTEGNDFLLLMGIISVLLHPILALSSLLAEMVTLAVLRLTGTAAEARHWTKRPRARVIWRGPRVAALSERFAGFLWGPAWDPENRGGEANGA